MPGEIWVGSQGQFLLQRSSQAPAQASQGGGGVTMPRGVQNHGAVALGDTVSRHGGGGQKVGQPPLGVLPTCMMTPSCLHSVTAWPLAHTG